MGLSVPPPCLSRGYCALRQAWAESVCSVVRASLDERMSDADEFVVVIGAGASGSVIAARVSENPNRRVLLVEAGPDYGEPALLPRDLADGRYNSFRRHDWGFRHRPTVGQIRFPLPRGRVVGGSSAVNTCIAWRGNPYDYDEWASFGLPEWSWEKCFPAFKRLENDLDMVDEWHGQGGPLPLQRPPESEWVPWQAAFVEASDRLGIPRSHDTNNPTTTGTGPHTLNRIQGRRVSAAEAWLTPEVRARPNLTIQANTLVQRILFRNRQVVGVELVGPTGVTVQSTRHVVLCAGAIQSPHLLLRSGVGSRADLEHLKVEVVAESPGVAARLLDHPGFAVFFMTKSWRTNRRDPLMQTAMRYQSRDGQPNDMLMQPGSVIAFPSLQLNGFSIMSALGKPKGYGTIRWESARTDAKPVVENRFLEHPQDRGRAVEAIERMRDLASQPCMSKLAWHLVPLKSRLRSAELIDGWIRRMTDSGYHPCGTLPMGVAEDPMAVCDGRGRVRGVEGLRVGDASLMPSIPASNIHLPTLMIGERMGEWLRDESM
jgi:choline dehydrogenase